MSTAAIIVLSVIGFWALEFVVLMVLLPLRREYVGQKDAHRG